MTWLDLAGGTPFGLDNLPLGIFSTPGTSRRSGVAVGDRVLDLAAVTGDLVHATGTLNAFLARGAPRLGRAARTGHRLAHRGAAPAGRRAATRGLRHHP